MDQRYTSDEFITNLEGHRELILQIINSLRDTKDITQEKGNVPGQEAGIEQAL